MRDQTLQVALGALFVSLYDLVFSAVVLVAIVGFVDLTQAHSCLATSTSCSKVLGRRKKNDKYNNESHGRSISFSLGEG